MGYPLTLALRYLTSKKRNMISISTALAIVGVTLGVAALTITMSVTAGFQEQFRDKVLGVNAHVLVLKYSIDFREYRDVMKKVQNVKGVVGVAPFVINPMMITHATPHGDRTATGVLLKGVDPILMPKVLDLPSHITEGTLDGLRRPGAEPPKRSPDSLRMTAPSFDSSWDTQDGGVDPVLEAIRRQAKKDADHARTNDRQSPLDGLSPPDALDAGTSVSPSPTTTSQVALPVSTTGRIKGATDAGAAPYGNMVPDGGYGSTLPPDDDLPTNVAQEIAPDPCRDPELVKQLPGVVIGKTLAEQLAVGIKADDNGEPCVQITSPTIGISYGSSSRPPIAKQFRVIAIFEAGFDQYDSKLIYSDLYEAQAFYEYGDSVTGVEMKVDDIDRAHDIATEIDGILNNGVYHTMDWRELNHGLFTALLIQQIGMSVMLGLIIVVAAFTVIATLIMVVLDKKKEIALLKAIGARDGAILRVFLYQGGIMGGIGTTLGLLIGYLSCRFLLFYGFPLDPKVYFISRLPVSMNPTEFIITGTFAMFICLLGTIFPALHAAGLRPADGLRNE